MSCLVVALNPSVDVEWRVDSVRWEEKNVIQSERRWPGGKGVNVARWLTFLRSEPTLVLPLGGASGEKMKAALSREKIKVETISISQATRENIIVTSPRGQLRFNPPGPKISKVEWQKIKSRVEENLDGKKLLILSGSLPLGVPADAYAQLLKIAQRKNVSTILDCDGVAFQKTISSKPFLVKPNEFELSQWAGEKIKSERALVSSARKLAKATTGWVLVSRGAKGAILLNAQDSFYFSANAPAIKPRNTVGAGDAMLAAVAEQVQNSAAPEDWLRWGVAVGTAATQCRAGELPSRKAVQKIAARVTVTLRQ